MKLKKIIALALTLTSLATVFTGCGSKENTSADAVTVKIGVVGAIYEDLWKPAQDSLKAMQSSRQATPSSFP